MTPDMPDTPSDEQIDDDVLTFTPTLPGRETGKVLLVIGLLAGVLMAMLATSLFVGTAEEDLTTARLIVIGFTVGFWMLFLVGLHLLTRRQRVLIAGHQVAVVRHSWVWRRTREFELAEFSGLMRTTRFEARRHKEGNVAGFGKLLAIAMVFALSPVVIILARSKRVAIHCLMLRGRPRRRDILLLCSESQPEVHKKLVALGGRLALPVLDHSLEGDDGYVERDPADMDTPMIERIAPARSAVPLPPAPRRVRIKEAGGVLTILAPHRPRSGLLGACLGTPFIALGVWLFACSLRVGTAMSVSVWLLVTIVTGPGVAFWLIGAWKARPRPVVAVYSHEVRVLPRAIDEPTRHLPWQGIRHVSIAREPDRKRLAVVITTDRADHWIAAGNRREILLWLHDAILAKAAEVAGRCE